MDLIPITKIKISKADWLSQAIKYEENYFIRDVVHEMSHKTYLWIINNEDMIVTVDFDSFKEKFINLLYTKYVR